MRIRALIFKTENPDLPLGVELPLYGSSDLENLRQTSPPSAYLVRNEDLKTIRKFEEFIVDRGVKHKAKGLSKLLLGHKLIPLIEGNFESARQLGRSIRTLLSNAKKKQDQNVYFIGIAPAIFDEIWGTSKGVNPKDGSDIEADPLGPGSLEEYANVSSWLVRELFYRCQVPQDLTDRFIGHSPDAVLVRQLVVLAANSENEVLIIGDTGTGKEVVARAIHDLSNRKGKKFLAINCGGIPSTLLESELFGYVKGAFTGASSVKEGLWKTAGDGTLFLDEIGDLPIESQAKILRTLEDGKIWPVGSKIGIDVSARVIAATNRDLFGLAQKGEFREDLYYRLRSFLIRTPSLRRHVEDIPVLADFMWKKITKDSYKPLPRQIVESLNFYCWPGNVRELKKVLENLHTLFGVTRLSLDHLKAVFYLEGQEIPSQIAPTKPTPGVEKRNIEQVAAALHHLKQSQEVIRSLEIQFERRKTRSETTPDVAFKFGMYELEILCRQPSLFGDAFPAVWGLLESLNRYQEPFPTEEKEMKKWQSQLSEAFREVQTTLSSEKKRIVESVLE